MAENEGMEEKDLALEQKKEFEAQLLEVIKDLKTNQTTISIEGIEVTNYGEQYTIKLRGITFGIIDKQGNFTYNKEKFKQVKKALEEEGVTLDDLGLPDIEQSIDQEKEPKEEEKEDKEPEQITEEETEKEEEKEEEQEDIEKDKERIAKELEIDPEKIYPIREDSAFYENHLGMFPGKNLFFYEDKQGNIKVGTKDKNGKPIEDKEHFTTNEVAQNESVIRLGDGRENIKREIPLQTIEIKNPAKENGEKDIHDRFIAVYRGEHGYLEFEEVEQSRETGELVGERIEVERREYNTEKMNERTQNRSGGQTPGETSKNVESEEERDGEVEPDEAFNDNQTFREAIKEDIVKIYGPKHKDTLDKMADDTMELIKQGEEREQAIAKVGIQERDEGGVSRGEKIDRRG